MSAQDDASRALDKVRGEGFSAGYAKGVSDGGGQALAYTSLSMFADQLEAARQRLTRLPEATGAVNEAIAILRDAARDAQESPEEGDTPAAKRAGKPARKASARKK